MWRSTAVAGLVVMGIAVLSTQTTSVHACSRGEVDLVAESDVILEGRVTSYETTLDPPVLQEDPMTGELRELENRTVTERMNFEIVRVLKGNVVGDNTTILYTAWEPGSILTAQRGSVCGDIASDKTGTYTIVGLTRNDSGELFAAQGHWFFTGQSPADEHYSASLERLASFPGAAGLPALGTGAGPAPSTTSNHLIAGIAALGAALLAASFAIRFRTDSRP